MKALIEGTRVAELHDTGFPVHEGFFWVDAPEGVTTRHTYVDGAFVDPPPPPPPPTYRQLRAIDYAAELGQEPGAMNAIGDSLDVIFKQFNQMRLDGQPLIQEADGMLGKILAIKARHPKPV